MKDQVITHIDQVTTQWLTTVLTTAGALNRGQVTAFTWDNDRGNWSTNASLTVTYSDDAQGTCPRPLFLKMVDVDLGDDESFGPSEVNYYRHDYVDVPDAPLIPCYDAAYSETLLRYHVLLDDVSRTHVEASAKEPTLEYGLALAEALATLHARWWGARRLAAARAPLHDAAHIQRFIDIAAPGVEHILGRFSAELQPHWPDALRDLFAGHPRALIERARDLNGFTLIHGDAGYNNILVPRQGPGPIYLIDRQPFDWSLTTWLGVYDLAYAIILDWDTEIRRRHELAILRRYHDRLIEKGVGDYSWQRLFDDYRLCVAMGAYIATEYCRGGINERLIPYWLPKLRRTLTACDDLDCRGLW